MKTKLSIVILNHNTSELLKNCLTSIYKVRNEIQFEVIVIDNASSDNSCEMVEQNFKWVKLIKNKENLGFAKGNNKAKDVVSGEYVLILNSDTIITKGALESTVKYIDSHEKIGALSCKLLTPSGVLDKDTRRSFPTPWVSLTHFSALDRIFPKLKLFSKYWYGYIPDNQIHEVEVIQGAFTMARRKVLDDVNWYDENYFLDGEDIDLCWKIRHAGWKIIYYPEVSIIHVKKGTKSKFKSLSRLMAGVDSMEIFYKKRLWAKYPLVINLLVIAGINIIRFIRYIKFSISK